LSPWKYAEAASVAELELTFAVTESIKFCTSESEEEPPKEVDASIAYEYAEPR